MKKIRQNLINDDGIHIKESNSYFLLEKYSFLCKINVHFAFYSDSKAIWKALVICVLIIMLNVYVNSHVVLSLTRPSFIDPNQQNLGVFRLFIASSQVIGSILCLIIVDSVERKVRKDSNYIFSDTICSFVYKNPSFLLSKALVIDISSGNHSFSTGSCDPFFVLERRYHNHSSFYCNGCFLLAFGSFSTHIYFDSRDYSRKGTF